MLLGVLITFGLLDKSSELIAMKASGFSVYRATLPVVVICGIVRRCALFVFDQYYIPKNQSRAGNPAQ